MAHFYTADQSSGSSYSSSGSRIAPQSDEAYAKQVASWLKYSGMFDEGYNAVSPYAKAAMEYFKPGGGYGVGQKMSATKKIRQGVASDTINAVNAGMSSMSSARGLQTRAGSELATQYRNIEDQRATLGLQANSSYVNMINSLSWLATGYPKYQPTVLNSSSGGSSQRSSSVRPVPQPQPSGGGGQRSYGGGGYQPEYVPGQPQITDYSANYEPGGVWYNYGEDVSSGSNVDYWPNNSAYQADDIPYASNYNTSNYDAGDWGGGYVPDSSEGYTDNYDYEEDEWY